MNDFPASVPLLQHAKDEDDEDLVIDRITNTLEMKLGKRYLPFSTLIYTMWTLPEILPHGVVLKDILPKSVQIVPLNEEIVITLYRKYTWSRVAAMLPWIKLGLIGLMFANIGFFLSRSLEAAAR